VAELAGYLPIASEASAYRPLKADQRGVQRVDHGFKMIVFGLHTGG
jgi:hypothetical protein